jgi:aldose 1-epimerase
MSLLELRSGDARVTISPELGGRLASWTARGQELFVGPPTPGDPSIRWGCYLMAPWAGRLANGRFEWAGAAVQLPRTHGRHAIHGLGWGARWQVDAATSDRATLSLDLGPAGWPMGGRVTETIRLRDDRLVLEAEIEAERPMPAALGWHPWFRRDGEVRLRVDADATLETRGMIPTGAITPVTRRTDLRRGPALANRRIDDAFVDVRSPVIAAWDDLELAIAFEPSPATVIVYTPPESFCVEPQTAWPNAFALPSGLAGAGGRTELGAGETLRMTMQLSLRFESGPGRD